MKDFVKDFLFVADIDGGSIRVGVIIYSTEDYLQFNLNQYNTKMDVFMAIDDIPYRFGSTNTADALRTMYTVMYTAENGDRPGVPNVCIVVTDGISNINSRRTIPDAEQARAKGIHIYAIGIGLTDTTELDGIASKPVDENRFAVQEFEELRGLRDKVFSALCPGLCLLSMMLRPIILIKLHVFTYRFALMLRDITFIYIHWDLCSDFCLVFINIVCYICHSFSKPLKFYVIFLLLCAVRCINLLAKISFVLLHHTSPFLFTLPHPPPPTPLCSCECMGNEQFSSRTNMSAN